ncbi:MAG: RluA family pseudouridine synthase [Lachnospiraceae bacterium]|nr:RluA family pseudouridine synthase [Lachnospiraceae bacterium]
MIRDITYLIDQDAVLPATIEQFLRKKGFSHPLIYRLKQSTDGILLNGVPTRANTLLQPQDSLSVHIVEAAGSEHIVPTPVPLNIIYEDEDLLVLNKPAFQPIHSSINHYENTLANGVAYYFEQQNIPFVFRCINRLDRDTTGLTIIAKNMLSGSILSTMVSNREIHRKYLAIVEGILPESGTIDAPIARKDGSVIEREVNFEAGDSAVTHYTRLSTHQKNGKEYSLAAIILETGRTHQIRIHMNYIGHPLPGDFLYHPDMSVINRQALHSHSLEFKHPITGALMYFEAPLPADMKAILCRLKE